MLFTVCHSFYICNYLYLDSYGKHMLSRTMNLVRKKVVSCSLGGKKVYRYRGSDLNKYLCLL